MEKVRMINTGIGVASVAIQLYILAPANQKISNDIKNLETRIDQTNQILKEERQKNGREFKDL